MVAGEARKVSRFRKCFDACKLTRLADGDGRWREDRKITFGFLNLATESDRENWKEQALEG